MFTQQKKTTSIKRKMLSVVLFPIVLLGAMIVIFGILLLYRSYTESIQEELASATSVLLNCLDLTVEGDYSYENDMLFKGALNLTDSIVLSRIKDNSQIDTTIFWQDTRVLTTIKDENGISAAGTKASESVVNAVLQNGNNYYSNRLDINGVAYIGYYMPLKNSDQSIVGMVFAGKKSELVYDKVFSILLWFAIFSLIAIVIAFRLSRLFSNQMVFDINIINGFLKTISEGDLTATLDDRIVVRKDELGAIGLHATKMQDNLRKLIGTDPLTSLFNRRSCNNKLRALEQDKEEFCIVMCDIDWFKKINDTYGHDAGDYVLVTISQIFQENIKDCGFASRWGGEEFLLVYGLGLQDTRAKVEQLQNTIREFNFQYQDKSFRVTMTFGIEGDHTGSSYEERIKEADNKLYVGKNDGRNQIVC
ncbi:MAG: diguanylate cyclase [Lachnospiraceae bacterium]|nr:diguanylate cyclase [Lachnospiraceae bacterium]